jgi:hypothetical protein
MDGPGASGETRARPSFFPFFLIFCRIPHAGTRGIPRRRRRGFVALRQADRMRSYLTMMGGGMGT